MEIALKLIMVTFLLILGNLPVYAADAVEPPAACQQCGMDRSAFARSRVLIVYDDGTTAGTCSIRCAVEEMQKSAARKVKSLMVADYNSKELIDARSATWVVGGDKKGGMNSPPKWAFAKEEDASKFVGESGGKVTSYEQVIATADKEGAVDGEKAAGHHGHMGHDMGCSGPGSQMLYNPAFGDDIYHTHPAGMWMANYRFMHTSQSGLRDGTTNVPVERVIPSNTPYGYMMAPTSMGMDMHMLMVMYGVTDRFTLMGMATYQSMTMNMLMNMGSGNTPEAPMRTSGIGDTELRGIFKVNEYLVASLGLSIPTGDIKQQFETMGMTFRAPYDMQLGSGTFDLKPALTYNDLSHDAAWNWGGQASYTYHVDRNSQGYTLGDNVKFTTWLQRAFGPASTWLRLAYNYTGQINGRDPEIERLLALAPTPDANTFNYGGHRIDGLLGVSYVKGPFSFGVEGGIPFYQNLNGLQLKNEWYLTVGIQAMF